VRRQVGAHALGEHLEGTLGGGVRRDAGPGHLALQRADVHDLAPGTLLDHHARHLPADVERAAQVGVEKSAPILVPELDERRTVLHPGVVDQDVDRGAELADPGDARTDRLRIGDVERDRVHGGSGGSELGLGLLQPLGIAAVDNHRAAALRQSVSQRLADAATGAGDERGLP
jgi:hypothetical protein